MQDRIEELILDYLNGTLSVEDQQEWDRLLAEEIIRPHEIKEYEALYGNLDRLGEKEPSPQMTDNFYSMLNGKINQTSRYTILDQVTAFFAQQGFSRGGL